MNQEPIKCFAKQDFAILALLLFSSLIFLGIDWLFSGNTSTFIIKNYSEKPVKEIHVDSKDCKSLELKGKLGRIQIEFNEIKGARVSSSTCPCQTCANQGWCKFESIVCVPNEVLVIPIKDSSQMGGIDAVTK